MRRTALGLSSAALLAAAGALWYSGSPNEAVYSALLRAGAVLGVLWLAYDPLARLPAWILGGVPVLALLVVLTRTGKWLLLLLVPVLVVMAIVKPRRRRNP